MMSDILTHLLYLILNVIISGYKWSVTGSCQ